MINPSADAVNILRIYGGVLRAPSTNLKDLRKVIQVGMGWLEFTANVRHQ
jgi:hypothetical protein